MSGQQILFDCCWTNHNGVRPGDEHEHVEHCWYWMQSATPQQTLNWGATAVCLPQGPMEAFKLIIRPLKEDLEVEKKSGI